MNATAEHPNLNQSTDIAVMYDSPSFDSSVLMLPDQRGLNEVQVEGSLSATPLSIDDWTGIRGFQFNLRTERDNRAEPYLPGDDGFARRENLDIQLHEGLYRIRFFQHDTESSTAILVDFWDRDDAFEYRIDPKHQEIVDELRNGCRELLAQDVFQMLSDSQESPENVNIKLLSLQYMARFLIKQNEFDDPIVGKDPHGIMQIEWHIIGNGLLVMAFLDDDQIHCVAQADATYGSEMLNESVRLTEREALEEFGHLVPLRQSQYR